MPESELGSKSIEDRKQEKQEQGVSADAPVTDSQPTGDHEPEKTDGTERNSEINREMMREAIEQMMSRVRARMEMNKLLSQGVIARNKAMIEGFSDDKDVPDVFYTRKQLKQGTARIEEIANEWLSERVRTTAMQMVVMKNMLVDMGSIDNLDDLSELVDRYVGDSRSLLFAINARVLAAQRNGAENSAFWLEANDTMVGTALTTQEKRARDNFYAQAEETRQAMLEMIDNSAETNGEGNDEALSTVTERLRSIITTLPPEVLTEQALQSFITRRLTKELKDPVRQAAFKAVSPLLVSAEEALGAKIILDESGKLKRIEVDTEDKEVSIVAQLTETEASIKIIAKQLVAQQQKVEEGDFTVVPEVTGLMQLLKEKIELYDSLMMLLKARLGVSKTSPLEHPMELLSSVNSRKLFLKLVDGGVIGAETALAAFLTYAAVHLGGDVLKHMANSLAKQLKIAPEQLQAVMQAATKEGKEFVQNAQMQNIPGGTEALGRTTEFWQKVRELDQFIKNAPGEIANYRFLSEVFYKASPVAAAVAAGLSLGRNKVADTLRKVSPRFKLRKPSIKKPSFKRPLESVKGFFKKRSDNNANKE